MTKQEEKNAVAVMLEWVTAEKPLEFRRRDGSGNWFECTKPCWNWSDFEFRLKAEPLEVWINPEQGTPVHTAICYTKPVNPRWRKFREVLE